MIRLGSSSSIPCNCVLRGRVLQLTCLIRSDFQRQAFVFATLHAIGHLTGTFLYGSRPAQQDDLALILGPEAVPKPYVGFVRTTPGWTGLVAYGLFLLIVICSLPIIRKRSYEFFQVRHSYTGIANTYL